MKTIRTITALAILSACAEPTTPASTYQDQSLDARIATARASSGETIYGLTANNTLVTFSSSKANQTGTSVEITGLGAGQTVTAIDFRPSDLNANGTSEVGQLYAVTNASQLYIIDPATGVATLSSTLSAPVSGSSIGFGFNPTVDRIRIHTNLNQNLRINPDGGATLTDGALAYAAGDANFGIDPDITATAYTNNDNNPATGTALFAIDARSDALVTFLAGTGGANSGQLTTVGSIGVDAGVETGFDISLASGTAYATIATSPSGKSTLYSIDLTTGVATKLGMLAQTSSAIVSIAVAP